MSFAIITDSTSDISPARAQELGIYVIPLHVIIEGEDLLDQVQITAEEYVARMAGSEQLPHTSQPSAGEFKALFDRVRADGHDSAIFISLCSEWSACYSNACLVAETHELDVRCIDSRTRLRHRRACWWSTRLPCARRPQLGRDRGADPRDAARRPPAADSPHAREPGQNGRAPKLAGQLTQMLNIRLAVSPEWKSGEIKAIKKGRGAKRIVANTMADCLAFWTSTRAQACACSRPAPPRSRNLSTSARGPGLRRRRHRPHRLHHRHPCSVDAIAISYCPRYQPIH